MVHLMVTTEAMVAERQEKPSLDNGANGNASY
jgi:hypothetical protein